MNMLPVINEKNNAKHMIAALHKNKAKAEADALKSPSHSDTWDEPELHKDKTDRDNNITQSFEQHMKEAQMTVKQFSYLAKNQVMLTQIKKRNKFKNIESPTKKLI